MGQMIKIKEYDIPFVEYFTVWDNYSLYNQKEIV